MKNIDKILSKTQKVEDLRSGAVFRHYNDKELLMRTNFDIENVGCINPYFSGTTVSKFDIVVVELYTGYVYAFPYGKDVTVLDDNIE